MGCSLLSYSFSTTAYDMNFGSAYSGGTELEIISGRDIRFELNARIDEGKRTIRIASEGGKGYFKVRLHDKRDYEGF